MDDILRSLATAGHVLPVAAMRAATAAWEQHAPSLLAVLHAYAAGEDRSDDAREATFFIAFLAAERRETRAFAPLCRLARDADAMEEALGDGVTECLAGILACTFDGSLQMLVDVIDAAETDEYVRGAALGALTILTAEGRIPLETAQSVLVTLHMRWIARGERSEVAWVGWQEAVALLGLEALRGRAIALFPRRIPPSFMDRKDFEGDLRDGLAAATPEMRRALLARHHLAPIDDAVALLSTWYGFSEERARNIAKWKAEEAQRKLDAILKAPDAVVLSFGSPSPALATAVKVGRNDACPCGSGRKYKKCCLAVAA